VYHGLLSKVTKSLRFADGLGQPEPVVGPEFVASCVDGSGQVNSIGGFGTMLCSQGRRA